MFMQPNSNKTISITVSDNNTFIITYYEPVVVEDSTQNIGIPMERMVGRFQMKILTANNIEEVVNLLRPIAQNLIR